MYIVAHDNFFLNCYSIINSLTVLYLPSSCLFGTIITLSVKSPPLKCNFIIKYVGKVCLFVLILKANNTPRVRYSLYKHGSFKID